MKFFCLAQATYKNDNGIDIPASEVEAITTYKYVSDGFYNWECGICVHKHSSRACGWAIGGQVLRCEACGRKNLLLRSDTDWVSQQLNKVADLGDYDRVIETKKKIELGLDKKIQELKKALNQCI